MYQEKVIKMSIKDFRGLSSDELLQKEKGFKKDLFDLQYERKMGRVEKPSRFKLLKQEIARIHTILKERELEDARRNKDTK